MKNNKAKATEYKANGQQAIGWAEERNDGRNPAQRQITLADVNEHNDDDYAPVFVFRVANTRIRVWNEGGIFNIGRTIKVNTIGQVAAYLNRAAAEFEGFDEGAPIL